MRLVRRKCLLTLLTSRPGLAHRRPLDISFYLQTGSKNMQNTNWNDNNNHSLSVQKIDLMAKVGRGRLAHK